MSKNNRFSDKVNIKNRKASYEYEYIDTYTAGIVLKGTEIKSIRESKVSLQESYCYFNKGELFIKGMHIAPYEQANVFNHDPLRDRKLLLHKKELKKIESALNEKGLTVIPTKLFISDRGHAKINIAVAKGKKLHDKRQSIKEKDMKRELSKIKL